MTYDDLKEYYDKTVGLWAIDRDPKEVDLEWITKNAFLLDIANERVSRYNMIPFNLEEAKKGRPVCTRDGRKARIICFDRKGFEHIPILALIEINGKEEYFYTYGNNGIWAKNGQETVNDLFLVKDMHEAWIVVFGSGGIYNVQLFLDEGKANSLKEINNVKLIKRITWSE